MTVQDATAKVTRSGNGVATTFSFDPLVIFDATQLVVVKTSVAGVETTVARGTSATTYSVSVAEYPGTGSIVYPASGGTPLASGETLTIKRVLPLTQTMDLNNRGGYFPDLQEVAFDKLTMLAIQSQEQVDRTLKVPAGETSIIELPSVALRAGKFLKFGDTGAPTAHSGTPSEGTDFLSLKADYGAEGDGVADDTAAVQAAFDAGVPFYAPAGNYLLSDTITFPTGAVMMGATRTLTVFVATHASDVFAPEDPADPYQAVMLSDFSVTKSANIGTGSGIRLGSLRSSCLWFVGVTNCDIGVEFVPDGTSTFSYFNAFVGLVLYGNTTSAFKIDTGGNNDIPNVNNFIIGDWRGGSVVADIVDGSGHRFQGVSIQGAGAGGHWMRIRENATGVILDGMRFENAAGSELTSTGLLIEASGVQMHGGTMSKGQFRPYLDDMAGRTRVEGFTVGGYPVPQNYGTFDAFGASGMSLYGGVGKYQNHLLWTNDDFGDAVWTGSGTFTRVGGFTDPLGGTGADRFTAGSTQPYRQQISTKAAASATVCYPVWLKGDTEGLIKLYLKDQGSEEYTRSVWVTREWQRFYVSHTFTSGATGNVIIRFQSEGEDALRVVYVWRPSLNDGVEPAIYAVTDGSAVTGTTPRFRMTLMGDFTEEGVATKVKAGAFADADFETPETGLIGLNTTHGRLEIRTGVDTFSKVSMLGDVGSAGTGFTAVEGGSGRRHETVLTVSTTLGAIAGGANLALGKLAYTFPAGAKIIRSGRMSIALTQSQGNITADTPDVGLGMVVASGANALLSATATFENVLTGQTAANCNGTATVRTFVADFVIETGDAHTLYLNVADGWAASGDAATAVTGTITVLWEDLA